MIILMRPQAVTHAIEQCRAAVPVRILRRGANMPPEHRWYKDSGGQYRLP